MKRIIIPLVALTTLIIILLIPPVEGVEPYSILVETKSFPFYTFETWETGIRLIDNLEDLQRYLEYWENCHCPYCYEKTASDCWIAQTTGHFRRMRDLYYYDYLDIIGDFYCYLVYLLRFNSQDFFNYYSILIKVVSTIAFNPYNYNIYSNLQYGLGRRIGLFVSWDPFGRIGSRNRDRIVSVVTRGHIDHDNLNELTIIDYIYGNRVIPGPIDSNYSWVLKDDPNTPAPCPVINFWHRNRN